MTQAKRSAAIEAGARALAQRDYNVRFDDADHIRKNVDANWSSWSDEAETVIDAALTALERPADGSRLSAIEIEAVLDAAGNCDVPAMYEDCPTEKEAKKMLAAYERGMDKLRDMLARRRAITAGKREG